MLLKTTIGLLALSLAMQPALAQSQAGASPGSAGSTSQLEQVGLTPPTVISEGHEVTSEEQLASTIFGQVIHASGDPAAEAIGTVEDLVVGPLGDITAAIIDISSFVGSDKQVAVDFNDITREPTESGTMRWVLETTREALADAPAFNWPEDPASDAGDVPDTPAEQADQMVDESSMSPIETDPERTTDQTESTTTGLESGNAVEPQPAELQGMGVYGVNDEPIGTINEVLTTPDGAIDALVIDVGGFLGLGAKPVAVAYENLSFGADTTGQRYLYLNTSRQALEAQPAYDPATYAEDRANQRMVIAP